MSETESLPLNWCRAPFGEIMKVRGGYAFKSHDYLDDQNGVPLIRQSELKGRHVDLSKCKYLPKDFLDEFGERYSVKQGDVLVGLSGSLSSVSEYKGTEIALQNQRTGLLQASPLCSSRFVLALYRSVVSQVEQAGKGVAVQNVAPRQIESIDVPIAPTNEQHRIVEALESYLSRLDDAVASLERVQHNLKRYRASVLKAAVEGRLVPTEAETARAECRDYEPAEKLLERILKERKKRWIEDYAEKGRAKAEAKAEAAGKPWTAEDDRMTLESEQAKAEKKYKEPAKPDTEGLPELPEGWCWATVDRLCAEITDGDHQAPPVVDNGIPFLVIGNVRSGQLDFTDCRRVPEDYYEQLASKRQPNSKDLLYTVTGSFGIPVQINDDRKFCVQRHIAILKEPLLEVKDYLFAALQSGFSFKQASKLATGTAQKTVGLASLRGIVIPLPPQVEQQGIIDVIDEKLAIAHHTATDVNKQLRAIRRLRQSILKSAFEGKLVDQDPNDEPASVLLERIKEERAKQVKTKARRGRKPKTA